LRHAAPVFFGRLDPAGDRVHGGALDIENSVLENSQNGIITEDPTRQEQVTVKNSQFFNDGSGNGLTHALYIGDALTADIENSLFCGTNNGHDIKSRAASTRPTAASSTSSATASSKARRSATARQAEIALPEPPQRF
jgi:hypothetical protein